MRSDDRRAEFDARFRELRTRFLDRCADDLVEIEFAIATPQSFERDKLRAVVHRLAGAAGTFGFASLSAAAGAADDVLMTADGVLGDELTHVVAELKAAIASG